MNKSRAFLGALLFPVLAGGGLLGCQPSEKPELPVTLAGLDSVLSELGGVPTASLNRGQRWRMISSIGAGLPPSSYKRQDLPESRSRGAALLQVYCVQCHWMPAPQMHTAAEWPILVHRMLMRARTLKNRLGGPLTGKLVGDVLLSGLETAELPPAADVDTLLAYLQRNALPAAAPGEYEDGPGADLARELCSVCHELPSPSAHTAAGWEEVVARMRANMSMMDVTPLTDEQAFQIAQYLRAHAARS
ncbi:MAG: hypothetical protein ACE5HQ_09710 [Gemmatimonadota bacterium]